MVEEPSMQTMECGTSTKHEACESIRSLQHVSTYWGKSTHPLVLHFPQEVSPDLCGN